MDAGRASALAKVFASLEDLFRPAFGIKALPFRRPSHHLVLPLSFPRFSPDRGSLWCPRRGAMLVCPFFSLDESPSFYITSAPCTLVPVRSLSIRKCPSRKQDLLPDTGSRP